MHTDRDRDNGDNQLRCLKREVFSKRQMKVHDGDGVWEEQRAVLHWGIIRWEGGMD